MVTFSLFGKPYIPVVETLTKEGTLFLMKESIAPDRRRFAQIWMTFDGSFEGRIYRHREACQPNGRSTCCIDQYEVCGVTETLPRIEMLVDEELDLL